MTLHRSHIGFTLALTFTTLSFSYVLNLYVIRPRLKS
jgi:hypothetical protein